MLSADAFSQPEMPAQANYRISGPYAAKKIYKFDLLLLFAGNSRFVTNPEGEGP
jgi:hypothetical protein